MDTTAAVTTASARPTPTHRLRRWVTVGLASLAFFIATVEAAAEPGDSVWESGGALSSA